MILYVCVYSTNPEKRLGYVCVFLVAGVANSSHHNCSRKSQRKYVSIAWLNVMYLPSGSRTLL